MIRHDSTYNYGAVTGSFLLQQPFYSSANAVINNFQSVCYPNPSIRAGFGLDYDRTTVLSYNFHAGSYPRRKERPSDSGDGQGSYDFYCAHTENQGVYGYDMVTELGSNLTCTKQTAVLEDQGQIEIIRQNLGFDPENGITRVTLDPKQEHYYLEVKNREDR